MQTGGGEKQKNTYLLCWIKNICYILLMRSKSLNLINFVRYSMHIMAYLQQLINDDLQNVESIGWPIKQKEND